MAQGSPGQDSQPSLLPDCGSTSNLERRLGQVSVVINYSLLGKGPETLRARTQILNQNLLKSSIVPISQTSQFCFVNNSFIFRFKKKREQQSVVYLQNPPDISGFWLKTLYTSFVFCLFAYDYCYGGGGGEGLQLNALLRLYVSPLP